MFEPHLYRLRPSLPLDVCDTFVQGSQLTEKTALDKKHKVEYYLKYFRVSLKIK